MILLQVSVPRELEEFISDANEELGETATLKSGTFARFPSR